MFDAPLDAMYVWLGLGVVSLAVAGTALALPTAAPPDPGPVADTVDDVAASAGEARASVEVTADRLRLSRRFVALRSEGGTVRARFAFGPVTPATGDRLGRVLHGTSPAEVFRSKRAFRTALDAARSTSYRWRPAPERLTVCRVTWGGIDATLVG
jgi:hypothetical protein